eukprot:gnl/Spiro4/9310_TR4904_c0_g2_i1.p1 gnl/Spiro4/9310_TR4904_c0_g2~~gnl/Spiro4/9310_TR4904_c0_g2_i1.p1  ORF type:complete len:370 (-),score=14.76 gnl/Spiro4/9310_TR4904_c0_g2_i1:54-1163(-)
MVSFRRRRLFFCNCEDGFTYTPLSDVLLYTSIEFSRCAAGTAGNCSWNGLNPQFCIDDANPLINGTNFSQPDVRWSVYTLGILPLSRNIFCHDSNCSLCSWIINDAYLSPVRRAITDLPLGLLAFTGVNALGGGAPVLPLCSNVVDVITDYGVTLAEKQNFRRGSFQNFIRVIPGLWGDGGLFDLRRYCLLGYEPNFSEEPPLPPNNCYQDPPAATGLLQCDLEYICQGSVCVPSGRAVCFVDVVVYVNLGDVLVRTLNFSLTDTNASWTPRVINQKCCGFYRVPLLSGSSLFGLLGTIGGVAGLVMVVFRCLVLRFGTKTVHGAQYGRHVYGAAWNGSSSGAERASSDHDRPPPSSRHRVESFDIKGE